MVTFYNTQPSLVSLSPYSTSFFGRDTALLPPLSHIQTCLSKALYTILFCNNKYSFPLLASSPTTHFPPITHCMLIICVGYIQSCLKIVMSTTMVSPFPNEEVHIPSTLSELYKRYGKVYLHPIVKETANSVSWLRPSYILLKRYPW